MLGDTWEWDGNWNYWTQVANFGPPPRSAAGAAFTSAGLWQGPPNATPPSGWVVLFGGNGADGSALGDTWVWDGSHWTQVANSGPPPRSGHVMVFDSGRGVNVLFGGSADGTLRNDTWEWDGRSWRQALVREAPPPRELAGGAYDGNRTVVFGGTGDAGTVLGDTWEWDAFHWTKVEGLEEPNPEREARWPTTDRMLRCSAAWVGVSLVRLCRSETRGSSTARPGRSFRTRGLRGAGNTRWRLTARASGW